MNEDEFIRGRVKRLQEIAADADPFVKKRLLRLADDYKRRLTSPRSSLRPTSHEIKTTPER